MTEPFGSSYAGTYDLLYQDKDYVAECDLLEKLFEGRDIKSVVDLGCGTGGHAVVLSSRGYEVIGIDRSSAMLDEAREKARRNGVSVEFRQGDVRSFQLDSPVDATLAMFAVLGYQLANDDVLSTLKSVRSILRPDGLFVFDVWYGPAVLAEGPTERVRVIENGNGSVIRASAGVLDISQHRCDVTMRVWTWNMEGLAETMEEHAVRYFFPMELRLLLEGCGFELERLGAFPDFDRDPDLSTWNVIGLARAR